MKADEVTLMNGDCASMLSILPEASIDAVVTDPPYEIGFNGSKWDSTGIAMRRSMWEEVLRVTKPGSYLLAFGATRTYHRMTSAIEDAGFEIHDCLPWLYANGFPKHRSKLKPSWEPVVMARKKAKKATPLNIETTKDPGGRWPANVMFDEGAAAQLDAEVPDTRPSRFFYVAKATPGEKDQGLSGKGLRKKNANLLSGLKDKKARDRFNHHPTVKPIELMRRLVRLVTPDGGAVLDPFTGSGTTGCAAVMEGARFVGIELDKTYFKIAESRIRHWKEQRG